MGFIISKELDQFIEDNTTPQDEVLKALDRATHLHFMMPQMISGTVQGKFLEMLSCMAKPERILEIGTFTGYSTICFAKGLSENGKIITIDVNEELEDTARAYFEKAGLTNKIDFRIGNAMEIIPALDEVFDMVFIDADKINYTNYYDLVFPKLKVGGFILADNVLWSGKVVEDKKDKDTQALIDFSMKVQNDNRVENVMLSVRDGILLARKIKN
ncbi:MAG: O-methyltransferase [Bacteroidetes bacterium]|nr:O-methyltransferase [Bacteroidota bacterium]